MDCFNLHQKTGKQRDDNYKKLKIIKTKKIKKVLKDCIAWNEAGVVVVVVVVVNAFLIENNHFDIFFSDE